jgi:hypothetical protein
VDYDCYADTFTLVRLETVCKKENVMLYYDKVSLLLGTTQLSIVSAGFDMKTTGTGPRAGWRNPDVLCKSLDIHVQAHGFSGDYLQKEASLVPAREIPLHFGIPGHGEGKTQVIVRAKRGGDGFILQSCGRVVWTPSCHEDSARALADALQELCGESNL